MKSAVLKRQQTKNFLKGGKKKKMESKPKLTQILERDENGKSKLNLTPIKKTAVHTPTLEDYNTLMQVCECGGWKWYNERLSTAWDIRDQWKEETCVFTEAIYENGVGICSKGIIYYCDRELFQEENWDVISTSKFYEIQKVTPEMIKELNEWFNKNK